MPREVVCSIHRSAEGGYRLLVKHGEEMQADEGYLSALSARIKANALRAELMNRGWTLV
jgi:hypothetical protein